MEFLESKIRHKGQLLHAGVLRSDSKHPMPPPPLIGVVYSNCQKKKKIKKNRAGKSLLTFIGVGEAEGDETTPSSVQGLLQSWCLGVVPVSAQGTRQCQIKLALPTKHAS